MGTQLYSCLLNYQYNGRVRMKLVSTPISDVTRQQIVSSVNQVTELLDYACSPSPVRLSARQKS